MKRISGYGSGDSLNSSFTNKLLGGYTDDEHEPENDDNHGAANVDFANLVRVESSVAGGMDAAEAAAGLDGSDKSHISQCSQRSAGACGPMLPSTPQNRNSNNNITNSGNSMNGNNNNNNNNGGLDGILTNRYYQSDSGSGAHTKSSAASAHRNVYMSDSLAKHAPRSGSDNKNSMLLKRPSFDNPFLSNASASAGGANNLGSRRNSTSNINNINSNGRSSSFSDYAGDVSGGDTSTSGSRQQRVQQMIQQQQAMMAQQNLYNVQRRNIGVAAGGAGVLGLQSQSVPQ
mmetsp:Transcript_2792/g.5127  ORF Transcript_2792/g.5127 Transcript_2792/m.5127 type:complete len:288 (+) Transcript_2792:388-1251(+)